MGLLLDPAALGGLAGLIAVTSWAIGRAHASSIAATRREAAAHDAPSPPPGLRENRPAASPAPSRAPSPAPCQQRALEERRAALAHPFVLAELHAEVSAIRRDERILGPGPGDDALVALPRMDLLAPSCRFIGLSGQPTCPVATRSRCAEAGQCHAGEKAIGPGNLSQWS